jgi:hypothetical protein
MPRLQTKSTQVVGSETSLDETNRPHQSTSRRATVETGTNVVETAIADADLRVLKEVPVGTMTEIAKDHVIGLLALVKILVHGPQTQTAIQQDRNLLASSCPPPSIETLKSLYDQRMPRSS